MRFDVKRVLAIRLVHQVDHVVHAVVLTHDRFGRPVEENRFVRTRDRTVAVLAAALFRRNPDVQNGSTLEKLV